MKKFLFLTIVFFLCQDVAFAGLSVSQNYIFLKAGETKTDCSLFVYSTLDRKAQFHVTYPNLGNFVEKIEPNDFYLDPIVCPKEPEARRKCIREICEAKNGTSCEIVCTTFKGPFYIKPCITELFSVNKSLPGCGLSFGEKQIEIKGGVSDIVKIGSSSFSESFDYIVYYSKYDVRPVMIKSLMILIFLLAFYMIFVRKRKKGKR